MDLELGPEDLAFREEVRAFLREHLPEHLRRGALLTPGTFTRPEVYKPCQAILHAKGWLAYHWPKRVGGLDWSPVQRYIFESECARARAPVLPIQGLRLVAPVIYTFGTTAQQEYFLPRILNADHVWCQGYSEPEAGSDLAALRTRAVRVGNEYRVTGTKIWTTHAHFANWMFVLVKTDTEAKPPQAGITFLLLDMRQPGVEVRPIVSMSGEHEFNEVFLNEARVPIEQRIGAEGQGWNIAKFLLEQERGGSCMAPRLLTQLEELRCAMSEGRYACGNPDRLARLAELEIQAQALEVLELRALADLAAGRRPGPQTSVAKLVFTNIQREVDRLRLEAYGYAGLQLDVDAADASSDGEAQARLAMATYLSNSAWSIMGGSDEVMKNIVAKAVLNLPGR
jgi:alkylation response protein AidB-like acyl-CoA dehydrogenase